MVSPLHNLPPPNITDMVKAATNPTSRQPTHQQSEVNLSGGGTTWDVHFTRDEDLTDAITFSRNVDETPSFPGKSFHTISIFGDELSIRFRDSRTLFNVSRPDRHGKVRNLEITVWAIVEIKREQYDVVRHEKRGDDWLTLVKLRPGQSFGVMTSNLVLPQPGNPRHMSHSLLRLWTKRAEIAAMPYLAIVVRDYKTYNPWGMILQKKLFGLVVVSTAVEDEPLIDLSDDPVDDPPEAPGASAGDDPGASAADDPGVGSSRSPPPAANPPAAAADDDKGGGDGPPARKSQRLEEPPAGNPFRVIYEGARHASMSGKGKGKGKQRE
jgi:hypothetical protein